MENFIGTIVFLLPGFLMYFWLQSFGINPAVKHSPVELTAIATLLWLPVSMTTILFYNSVIHLSSQISKLKPIWSIDDLKKASLDLVFLLIFLLLSGVISLIISIVWAKWIHPIQMKFINIIRNWRGIASFSNSPSVWEEVFANNDAQVVEIGRIDKNGITMIGCIKNASRTFEPERNLRLFEVDFFTQLVTKHNIPVTDIFYDIKSGSYVKVFDAQTIHDVQLLTDYEEEKTNSSEEE